jgi:hypothetical protein
MLKGSSLSEALLQCTQPHRPVEKKLKRYPRLCFRSSEQEFARSVGVCAYACMYVRIYT